ncbi:MAG: DNA helicase, partial [Deltaproteobacteria bacterium]
MIDEFSTSIDVMSDQDIQVELDVQTVERVNFASAQNDVAVLKSITLRNLNEAPLTDVSITLTSAPPILREKTWRIDRIRFGSAVEIGDLAAPLDVARLAGLDEAETGELIFEVKTDGKLILTIRRRIELLARDEWGGLGDMAHLLAAFVSPNDPLIAKVLKDASQLLERSGQDGSLDGYQSGDPRRVWMLAGAIWSAATAMGLSYAVPPASFERAGQKIRGPGRIASEGLATCLDSALLLAAAFEAAGLNPTMLFSQGHAWVGVWLAKRDFG